MLWVVSVCYSSEVMQKLQSTNIVRRLVLTQIIIIIIIIYWYAVAANTDTTKIKRKKYVRYCVCSRDARWSGDERRFWRQEIASRQLTGVADQQTSHGGWTGIFWYTHCILQLAYNYFAVLSALRTKNLVLCALVSPKYCCLRHGAECRRQMR